MIFYMCHYSSFCSLQFLAFDTEASHDMLKVWDGPPENEMSLSEISGSLLPERIHSTLNTVTVQFETDFYISKSGYAIQFSSTSCPRLMHQTVLEMRKSRWDFTSRCSSFGYFALKSYPVFNLCEISNNAVSFYQTLTSES